MTQLLVQRATPRQLTVKSDSVLCYSKLLHYYYTTQDTYNVQVYTSKV